MRIETFNSTPTRDEMAGGLRGLSERIQSEVPGRAWASRSFGRALPSETAGDFASVARCLQGLELGLRELWPAEDTD